MAKMRISPELKKLIEKDYHPSEELPAGSLLSS